MEYPSMESEVLGLASPWWPRTFLCSRLLMRPMISFPNFSFLEFVLKNQQVFDLLWCLVCHDIWFVWERSEFLQQAEGQMLTSKPFSVRNIQLHILIKRIYLGHNISTTGLQFQKLPHRSI